MTTTAQPTPTDGQVTPRRRSVPLVVGAVIVLVAGVVIGTRLGGGDTPATPPAATPPAASSTDAWQGEGALPIDDDAGDPATPFNPGTLKPPTVLVDTSGVVLELADVTLPAQPGAYEIPLITTSGVVAIGDTMGMPLGAVHGSAWLRGVDGRVQWQVDSLLESGTRVPVTVSARTDAGWVPANRDPRATEAWTLAVTDDPTAAGVERTRDGSSARTATVVPGGDAVRWTVTEPGAVDVAVTGDGWRVQVSGQDVVVWADRGAGPGSLVVAFWDTSVTTTLQVG